MLNIVLLKYSHTVTKNQYEQTHSLQSKYTSIYTSLHILLYFWQQLSYMKIFKTKSRNSTTSLQQKILSCCNRPGVITPCPHPIHSASGGVLLCASNIDIVAKGTGRVEQGSFCYPYFHPVGESSRPPTTASHPSTPSAYFGQPHLPPLSSMGRVEISSNLHLARLLHPGC